MCHQQKDTALKDTLKLEKGHIKVTSETRSMSWLFPEPEDRLTSGFVMHSRVWALLGMGLKKERKEADIVQTVRMVSN